MRIVYINPRNRAQEIKRYERQECLGVLCVPRCTLTSTIPAQITSQELADFGTTTLFFLLLVALPTGSYFYLHRGLVQRYEEMSSQVREHSRQVGSEHTFPLLGPVLHTQPLYTVNSFTFH